MKHRTLIPIESRLEGVNRANLKFTNFKHNYKLGLALELNSSLKERAKTGHKDRVSFNPFPLSNGHLDRVSFSSQSNGTLSPHKDHHIIGVSCLNYN
jgi:hypothetical protein